MNKELKKRIVENLYHLLLAVMLIALVTQVSSAVPACVSQIRSFPIIVIYNMTASYYNEPVSQVEYFAKMNGENSIREDVVNFYCYGATGKAADWTAWGMGLFAIAEISFFIYKISWPPLPFLKRLNGDSKADRGGAGANKGPRASADDGKTQD